MSNMKRIILVSTAVVLALLAACSGGCGTTAPSDQPGTKVRVEGGGYYLDIMPEQLYAMLAKKGFLLVNTESSESISEIEGTDLFIKAEEFGQNMDILPADKSAKIVLYCITGEKSKDVAAAMVKAGYTHVMHLAGGLAAWTYYCEDSWAW